MNTRPPANGVVFPMQRGPYQNNGASPWYATINLGTPPQPLKLAIDSGTNITWVTSTLCPPDQCIHFGGGRFDYRASSTFTFTDCLQRPYSFGPWGTMQVETASDVLAVPDGCPIPAKLFLAAAYAGDQFKQLNWDGGIGLPCSSAYAEGRSSFLLQELIGSGQLDPTHPYVAFDWNANDHSGTCQMGAIDQSKTVGPHLFLPWSVYSKLPGVEYIWSADLKSYSVGGETLASNIKFALDSGSSQFKGDDQIMAQTLALIARGGHPNVVLEFADGEITLDANSYSILIEEGPQKGQVLPQFAPLGLSDLVLVGSLVMEYCYTVYEYQIVQCSHEVYSLAPVGVWLFNRPDRTQIITRSSSRRFEPGVRLIADKKVILPGPARQSATPTTSVAGTWKNDYGSVMILSVSGNQVSGTYQSSTGSTGRYEVAGVQMQSAPGPDINLPVALAIEWSSTGDDPVDPSWNWCSGLSGQLSVTDQGDVLTLTHLLVATSDFPGLADRANYIDKLVYRRIESTHVASNAASVKLLPIENSLAGRWTASDGTTLELTVNASSQRRFGNVRGTLCTGRGAENIELFGFTDINAAAGHLSFQSVSLTAARVQDSTVISLSGALALEGDVLNLTQLKSLPTVPQNAYLATQLSSSCFTRKEPPPEGRRSRLC